MKTLKIHSAENIAEETVDLVEPGAGEIRLRMQYAGICGSDIHYYFNAANGAFTLQEPFTPGHEVSGIVDFDPAGKLQPGTPVVVHPAQFGPSTPGLEDHPHLRAGGNYLGSASTMPHTQGGMSQYLIVKDYMVRTLPPELSLKAAALAEPLAVALHALNIYGDVAGKHVLVSGSGPIGLLVVAAAAIKGAASVAASDILPGPLERAKAVGATEVFISGQDELPQAQYDVVFECAGVGPAITAALQAVRPLGTVVEVGMPANREIGINLAQVPTREITIKGSFRFVNEIDEAITLLAQEDVLQSVITHEFPASEVVEAFAAAKDSESSGKVLISLWLDDAMN